MLLWAIYDIKNDRTRGKIAKVCKKFGLYRVQKSVFLGTIEANRLDELFLISADLIDEDKDSVYFFPMCEKDFKQTRTLGQAFDRELVTDKVRELFI